MSAPKSSASHAPYAERRERFYERLGPKSAAILLGAREVHRNGTNTFRFRQASDLLFLSGFEEPDVVAVFTPGKPQRYTLFLRPRDKVRENWTGRRVGPDDAVAALGADQAFPLHELETRLYDLLNHCTEVYIHPGADADTDSVLLRVLRRLHLNERNGGRGPRRILDLAGVLHELRLVKDADALSRMRRAAAITCEAHIAAMRAARAPAEKDSPRKEFEIEALLDYVFRRNDGLTGYDTIVACGCNANTLHYTGGRDPLVAGQILLVDAGCEWGGFTADVTRSYPVAPAGGRPAFSAEQRRLYEVVLAAQKAGIAAARPGSTIEEIHDACVRVATEGLLKLGILAGNADEIIARDEHRRFYIHRTSHFLGMDVHDVGYYFPDGAPRRLLPGMVFTVEPGIYIGNDAELPLAAACESYRGIGIRIEDDVLITEDAAGHEVLTRAAPKEPDELLSIVGSGLTIAL